MEKVIENIATGGVFAAMCVFILWYVFKTLIPQILANFQQALQAFKEALAEAHRVNESQAKEFAATIQAQSKQFAETVDKLTQQRQSHHGDENG